MKMQVKEFVDLEQLSDYLLKIASERFSSTQVVLLKSKWPQVRQIVSQNAGYRSWGSHLLKLEAPQLDRLRHTLEATIQSIEGTNLDFIHTFIEKHPDLCGLRFLLDPTFKLNNIPINRESAIALFFEYNPELVAQHRSQFQELFKFLSSHPDWLKRDAVVAQMLVGNLIALLPYFDFEEGSSLSLLKFVEGEWKLISYQVVHVPLMGNKIIAYGLEPQGETAATPILIFRGTPYPTASGFFDAVLSDLNPAKSIGEDIFEHGKPQLDRWMSGKSKVECYGVSLGGALAYHAGEAYGTQVEVHAYGAPGLVPMKGGMRQIHGKVFFHQQDLVKLIGFHPESNHFEVYAILTEHDVDFVLAHARPPGIGPTLVLKIDSQHENRTLLRYIFNVLKIFVSTLLFLALFPIRLGVLIWEKIQENCTN